MVQRLFLAVLTALIFCIPTAAQAGDAGEPSFAQKHAANAAPAQDKGELHDSPYLRDSFLDLMGDFSIQSQFFSVLTNGGHHMSPLLNATSSVANVFVGFQIMSFSFNDEGFEEKSPWSAYMGLNYGSEDETQFETPTSGFLGPDNEEGVSGVFGLSVTF